MSRSVRDISGRTALVTGASSGIGADIARELAARGAHLIVVARRDERLRALEGELRERHGTEVDRVVMSLSEPGAARALFDKVEARGRTVDILVNDAGFGVWGPFLDAPAERLDEMIELNVATLTRLTRLYLPEMVARRFGYVLQVGSIGSFLPSPLYAVYSATKAYVLSFSEAVDHELRGTGVRVVTLCPGVTDTEFFESSGQKPNLYQRLTMMPSSDVARIGVEQMLAGKPVKVAGLGNALTIQSLRAAPRRLVRAVAGALMRAEPSRDPRGTREPPP